MPPLPLGTMQVCGTSVRCVAFLLLCTHRAPQASIEVGVVSLEMSENLEILLSHPGQIDLFDMHQPQQFTNGLGHAAPALIARTAALRDADPGPELLLIESE